MKIVRKNDIKSDKYYSYKHLGNAFGESLYEEEFNSVLYESDQQKAKDRQQIIDRVPEKTIKKDILYEKIFNLEPLKEITYTVESNYHDKSLTVLGSDNSSIIINWKYDIINWYVNENTLVFREVDRSTNEQYDRTINISNGKVEGSRRVMLEERFQEFVNKSIDEPERGPVGLGAANGIQGGPGPPVITLIGPNPISLECKGTYTEFGATANDSQRGPIGYAIGGDTVNTNTPGTYIIKYTATGYSGKIATKFRTVNIVDTIKPIVTLNGLSAVDVECSIPYNDLGATAVDHCDGELPVTIGGDTVNVHLTGIYVVSYSATDSSGNTGTNSRTVTVRDTIAPVVTLNGSSSINVECSTSYSDLGATAVDACDGSLSVTVSGTVDDSTAGTYVVTYTATDSSGNTGTATRTVTVVDTIAPVVTLNGANIINISTSDTYYEEGSTAVDACDGSLSVTVGGDTVDVSTAGTYVVTYSATDSSGNTGTNSRTVVVTQAQVGTPVVTLAFESSEKNAQMIGEVDPSGDSSVFNTNRVIIGELNRYLDGPRVDTTTYSRDNGNVTNTTGSENVQGYFDSSTGKYYITRAVEASLSTPSSSNTCGSTGTLVGVDKPRNYSRRTYDGTNGGTDNSLSAGPINVTYGSACDSECEFTENPDGSLSFVQPKLTYTGTAQFDFDWLDQRWEGMMPVTVEADSSCNGGGTSSSVYNQFVIIYADTEVIYEDEITGQSGPQGTVYTIPDTEPDALAAATASSGASNSSLYQLRTDSRNFTHRTASYTATASNLVVGVEYEGCVRIQRREAYSGTVPGGANTDWSDVASDTIAPFTATATQEEIATDVALPIAQGYEYQVVSIHAWAVSSGNSCPTS